MSTYTEIFQPFIGLFTQSQIHTILLAWLPVKFGPYMTGIMAVDMFLTSIIASGVTAFSLALYQFISNLTLGNPWKKDVGVTVQVEYYTEGTYGDLYASIFYESLSWLISQQTKDLDKGSFIVQHANSTHEDDDDENAPPKFNILPEKNQTITIEFKGKKFDVSFNMPEQEKKDENSNNNNGYRYSRNKPKPSIFITIAEDNSGTNVEAMNDFLNEVTRAYLESQKKSKVRSRYERNGSYWYHVQSLSSIRGLDTVALDEPQEKLLKKELETFISDKDFYGRIGMPYRRGIILFGKPGTGKTSLINAISSHLSRDIYYLNLKTIMDDNELSAAFSSVPSNQIIVLEDVDTQSKILHKRTRKESLFISSIESTGEKKEEIGPSAGPSTFSKFSLSTFLGCLDGNILSEGNIIIMTTNHIEHLDPACIRPGRMDVHLDLGYCTHYQIRKMYKSVVEDSNAEFPKDVLDKIPEKLLPPCEVMMNMVLYRNEIDLIPKKIYDLVAKYKGMKPEDIAKQMEEEVLRIIAASAEEKKEENSEVKKEEVKDENNEVKKEEIKDETKEEIKKKEEIKDEIKEEIKEKKEETTDENKKENKIEANKEEKKEEEITKEEITKEEITKEEITKEEITKEEITKEEITKEEITKEEITKEEITKEEITKEEITKEEEIIKEIKTEETVKSVKSKESEEIDKNETTNEEEEDSDSTDVEVENDKIKNVKVFETSTITSQTLIIN